MFSCQSDLVRLFLVALVIVAPTTTHAAWTTTTSFPSSLTTARAHGVPRHYSSRSNAVCHTQLSYRNRPAHEEKGTTTTTVLASSTPVPTTTAPSFFPTFKGKTTTVQEQQGGMNTSLMRDLVLGQVALVAAAVLGLSTLLGQDNLGAASSLYHQVVEAVLDPMLLTTMSHHNLPIQAAAVVATVALLISTTQQHGASNDDKAIIPARATAAWRLQFATNNLVVALWGRRGEADKEQQDKEMTTSTTIDTWTALVPTASLAAVTAVCQEVVFRYAVPGVVWQGTHSVGLALLLAALLDGLYHATSTTTATMTTTCAPTQREEKVMLMTQQCLQAAVLAALVIFSGGNLVPAIAAHALYLTHVWTTAWHGVNDQIDWAQQQQQQQDKPLMSAHDAHVWKALQEHAQGALTAQHAAVLQRFFYAFDLDHQGTLSLQNVQMAVAYSFWNNNQVAGGPTPTHVQALFRALVDARPADTGAPPDRLTWVEFLRLLVSLRAATRTSF